MQFEDTPFLYISGIDGKLHLRDADYGIWRLDESRMIYYQDLNNDGYFDHWQNYVDETITSELVYLDDIILYTDANGIFYHTADLLPEVFQTQPPILYSQYQELDYQLDKACQFPNQDCEHQISPQLKILFDRVASNPWIIRGGRIHDIRTDGNVYRIEVELKPGFNLQGEDKIGLGELTPGPYLIIYNQGTFQVEQLIPAQLSLEIVTLSDDLDPSGELYKIQLRATNYGNQDSEALEAVLLAECGAGPVELLRESVLVLGDSEVEWMVSWQPPVERDCQLSAALLNNLDDPTAQADLQIPAAVPSGRTAWQALKASTQNYLILPSFGLLGALGGLTGLIFWLRGHSGNSRGEN